MTQLYSVLILDEIDSWLFYLPRKIWGVFVLGWEYKTQLYSMLQSFFLSLSLSLSLSFSLSLSLSHGGSFSIYSFNASNFAVHL